MLILYLYCNACMIILWNAHNRSNKLLLLLLLSSLLLLFSQSSDFMYFDFY